MKKLRDRDDWFCFCKPDEWFVSFYELFMVNLILLVWNRISVLIEPDQFRYCSRSVFTLNVLYKHRTVQHSLIPKVKRPTTEYTTKYAQNDKEGSISLLYVPIMYLRLLAFVRLKMIFLHNEMEMNMPILQILEKNMINLQGY